MRVLIVDDDPDIRLLARTVLDQSDGFEVVGEAASGTEALDAVRALAPDLMLLDERLPDIAGVDVAREIRRERGDVLIVLFAAHLDERIRSEARASGVNAVVGKEKLLDLPARLALAVQDGP